MSLIRIALQIEQLEREARLLEQNYTTYSENLEQSRIDVALKDEHIKKLKKKVGELVMDLDIFKEATKNRPFDPETSDE